MTKPSQHNVQRISRLLDCPLQRNGSAAEVSVNWKTLSSRSEMRVCKLGASGCSYLDYFRCNNFDGIDVLWCHVGNGHKRMSTVCQGRSTGDQPSSITEFLATGSGVTDREGGRYRSTRSSPAQRGRQTYSGDASKRFQLHLPLKFKMILAEIGKNLWHRRTSVHVRWRQRSL